MIEVKLDINSRCLAQACNQSFEDACCVVRGLIIKARGENKLTQFSNRFVEHLQTLGQLNRSGIGRCFQQRLDSLKMQSEAVKILNAAIVKVARHSLAVAVRCQQVGVGDLQISEHFRLCLARADLQEKKCGHEEREERASAARRPRPTSYRLRLEGFCCPCIQK